MISQKSKGEMLKHVRFIPCDFNSELKLEIYSLYINVIDHQHT